jgi:hypothetical protein
VGSGLIRAAVVGLGALPDHPQAREWATAPVRCREALGETSSAWLEGPPVLVSAPFVHWRVMGVLFVDAKARTRGLLHE